MQPGYYKRSYAYNIEGPGWSSTGSPVRESMIVSGSELILLGEVLCYSWGNKTSCGATINDGGDDVLARHNGGANFLFCDGHVKWMLPAETDSPKNLWTR